MNIEEYHKQLAYYANMFNKQETTEHELHNERTKLKLQYYIGKRCPRCNTGLIPSTENYAGYCIDCNEDFKEEEL